MHWLLAAPILSSLGLQIVVLKNAEEKLQRAKNGELLFVLVGTGITTYAPYKYLK